MMHRQVDLVAMVTTGRVHHHAGRNVDKLALQPNNAQHLTTLSSPTAFHGAIWITPESCGFTPNEIIYVCKAGRFKTLPPWLTEHVGEQMAKT